jgi:integrase
MINDQLANREPMRTMAMRARRVNGKKAGMVRHRYKHGYLFKRGKRRQVWVGRWMETAMENGREIVKHRAEVLGLAERMSHRQARMKLDERLEALNAGTYSPNGTAAFSDFVATWLTLVFPNFKPSTQHSYRTVLETHLPHFNSWRLSEISKLEVQKFISSKFAQKLKWQTVRNIWIVLSSILESAVEYGYIPINPACGVKFPPKPAAPEPQVLMAEDFEKLLKELREPFKTTVMLAVLTGLRIGELCALRWRAMDFKSGVLRISESVFQGVFSRPKGDKERAVPLGLLGRKLLTEHLRRRKTRAPDDLIFSTRSGRPYREAQIGYRVLRPAAERAGIGRVTCHQLRHVHSSVLHDLGAPPKVIQRQLGHARVETTLNLYTHAISGTHRRVVEELEKALFPKLYPNFTQVQDEGRESVA